MPRSKAAGGSVAPIYEKLIRENMRPRRIVRMRPFESPTPALWEGDLTSEQERACRVYGEQWVSELLGRVVDAVTEVAREVGADPGELLKVWQWVVELKPPETRGRRAYQKLDVLRDAEEERARAARGSVKSDEAVAGLVGVSRETLRQYEQEFPWFREVYREALAERQPRRAATPAGRERPMRKKK